jgi:hypothetical protein
VTSILSPIEVRKVPETEKYAKNRDSCSAELNQNKGDYLENPQNQ